MPHLQQILHLVYVSTLLCRQVINLMPMFWRRVRQNAKRATCETQTLASGGGLILCDGQGLLS